MAATNRTFRMSNSSEVASSRMPEELCANAFWLPATGYYLKHELKADLQLPLLVAAGRLELAAGRRQRRRRHALRVGRHRRVDGRHLLGVEDVLELRDQFRRHA